MTATLAGVSITNKLIDRYRADTDLDALKLAELIDERGTVSVDEVFAAGFTKEQASAALKIVKTVVGIDTTDGQIKLKTDPASAPAQQEIRGPALRTPDREVDYRCSVMDHPGLSVGARYTGVAIVRHCFRTLELFAGMDVVAEWIGLSPESRKQAGKYVQELAEAGFLDPIGKAGRSTKYRLTIPERVDPPH